VPKFEIPKERLISLFTEFQPVRIKYKDIFDLKEFYQALHDWLLENGWSDLEDMLDHFETSYVERVSQGGVKEIWARWRLGKKVDEGRFIYYLDFDYHILGLVNTEVIKDGMKVKAHKGELDMYIRAYIDKHYVKDMKNHGIMKNFLNIFQKSVYHKEIVMRRRELYHQVYVLQNFIKQWFKLKRYLPYEETQTFYPSYAWPSHLKEKT